MNNTNMIKFFMLIEIKDYTDKLFFKVDEESEIIKVYPDQNSALADMISGVHLTEILMACELLQVTWSVRYHEGMKAPYIQISF